MNTNGKNKALQHNAAEVSHSKSESLSILFKSGLLFAALFALAISPGCASRQAGGGDQSPSSITIQLSDRRVTAYVILVPENANVYEKKAAEELQTYLGKITGANFILQTESGPLPAGPVLSVGLTKRFAEAFPAVDVTKIGADGIVLKSRGQDLFLVGEGTRGTPYAVYELLERYAGVRWWTKTEDFVPSIQKLMIPVLDVTYAPKLIYRDPYCQEFYSQDCMAFRARSRCNPGGTPPEYGGGIEIIGGVHTFDGLIPPDKYFKDNPDWFGEYDGVRRKDNSQLCLTSESMRKELTKNVLEWVRKNPTAGIISVSQDDNSPFCACAKCREVEQREGSPAGPLISFVNRVAEDIEKEYPHILVDTLAYQGTQVPPKFIKPRSNVLVRLCTFECSRQETLEDGKAKPNVTFREDLIKWSSISRQLFVWDYVTDFSAYLQPHPNLHVLAPNIRFLVKNKCIGLFNQGDVMTPCSDFQKLRAWLQAQLMWNPDLDEVALTKEFLDGYYGAASPILYNILNFYRDTILKSGKFLSLYETDTSGWLSLEGLNYLTEQYDEALRLAQGDPTLTYRIRVARMGLDFVWLKRYKALKRTAKMTGAAFQGPADPLAFCKAFIASANEFKLEWVYEGGPQFSTYAEQLLKIYEPQTPATPPAQCIGLAEEEWQDMQDSEFTAYALASTVKDAKASDSSAMKQLNNTGWSTQMAIPAERVAEGKWRCYVVARYEPHAGGPTSGNAFELAVWKAGAQNKLMVPLDPAAAGEYKAYDLGILPKNDGMTFYAASVNNPGAVDAFYIDRVFLVRIPTPVGH